MTTPAVSWPPSAPFTVAERDALTPDGHRYELIDGSLVVTPAPGPLHQIVVTALWKLLDAAVGEDAVAFVAPLDWLIDERNVVQPDLLVARKRGVTDRGVTGKPMLVVEVLSPATRRLDLGSKRLLYEDAGAERYWLVDPAEPSLTVMEGDDNGAYRTITRVVGTIAYHDPAWAIAITPAQLIAKLTH